MSDLDPFLNLKRLAEAATPGPRTVPNPGTTDTIYLVDAGVNLVQSHEDLYWYTDADRDFTAACSRDVILELIAEVELHSLGDEINFRVCAASSLEMVADLIVRTAPEHAPDTLGPHPARVFADSLSSSLLSMAAKLKAEREALLVEFRAKEAAAT